MYVRMCIKAIFQFALFLHFPQKTTYHEGTEAKHYLEWNYGSGNRAQE